jgi:hypothetical protein
MPRTSRPALLPSRRHRGVRGSPSGNSPSRLSGNAAGALAFVEVLRAAFERGFFEIGIPCSSTPSDFRITLLRPLMAARRLPRQHSRLLPRRERKLTCVGLNFTIS